MHAFVDETTARDYVMVAVLCRDRSVARVRRSMRRLLLAGRASVHFRKESDRRRRQILATVVELPVAVLLVRSTSRDAVAARSRCRGGMAAALPARGVGHLVLEQADGEVDRDRKALFEVSCLVEAPLSYVHLKRSAEPALWAPDAVGWAWSRGQDRRRRLGGLSVDVVQVD